MNDYKTTIAKLNKLIGDVPAEKEAQYNLLLSSYRDYFAAIEAISKHGIVIESTGGRLFVNPACGIKSESHKQIRILLKEFAGASTQDIELP